MFIHFTKALCVYVSVSVFICWFLFHSKPHRAWWGQLKKQRNPNVNFRKRDRMLGSYGTIIGSKRNGKVKTKQRPRQQQQQRNERKKKMLIKINMYSAKSSCIGCTIDYLIDSFYFDHSELCVIFCIHSMPIEP